MLNAPFDAAHLPESVFAVPPLARNAQGEVCPTENAKIIRFLEAGGIRSLLYGGNAIFYHLRLSEYADTLRIIAGESGNETSVVPSIGPSFGMAIDQVDVLHDFDFPTVMLLPSRDVVDQIGISRAIRRIAGRLAKPIVLYLKIDRWMDPRLIESLDKDGLISWVKYAVVRDDPADDDYLRELLDVFPAERVVSGIGEQPAIVHLRDFGITGFTSGCVCISPEESMRMLAAVKSGDYETAESIREYFLPLENLRNEHSPIRVLHHAVAEAGIANTGTIIPMLSDLDETIVNDIRAAVQAMA